MKLSEDRTVREEGKQNDDKETVMITSVFEDALQRSKRLKTDITAELQQSGARIEEVAL